MAPDNDTEIGLYRADGTLVASDDDDGSGLLSQLSFGASFPTRPPVGNGAAYNGRDGNLPAGTYYLSVSGFNSTFGASCWGVTSTSTSRSSSFPSRRSWRNFSRVRARRLSRGWSTGTGSPRATRAAPSSRTRPPAARATAGPRRAR